MKKIDIAYLRKGCHRKRNVRRKGEKSLLEIKKYD